MRVLDQLSSKYEGGGILIDKTKASQILVLPSSLLSLRLEEWLQSLSGLPASYYSQPLPSNTAL